MGNIGKIEELTFKILDNLNKLNLTKFTFGEEEYNKQWEIYNSSGTEDWTKCDYGNNMEILGFDNYLISSTIYGDWSCSTFNTDTKEKYGVFVLMKGKLLYFCRMMC